MGTDFRPLSDSPVFDAGNPELTDPDGSRSDIGIYGGPNARRPVIEELVDKIDSLKTDYAPQGKD